MSGALTLLLLLTAALVAAALWDRLGPGRALGAGAASTFLAASGALLILLDTGRLTPGPLRAVLALACGLVVAGAFALRRRLPRGASPRVPGAFAVAAAALLLGGVALRMDPSPYLHGGQDQGIYVNVGHHIARTGHLRIQDRVMAGGVRGVRGEEVRAAYKIRPPPPGSPLTGVREGRWIAGLHVEDASRGVLVPAFFHLLPAWLAAAEHDWGRARSTAPLVLFWILSALAAFGLAVRGTMLVSTCASEHVPRRAWCAGLLALAALALHPLDLWFSTFPVSEDLARACLLGAAWLGLEAASAEREGRPGATLLAALAGGAMAAGAFARGTMLACAIALAAALLLTPWTGRARRALLLALVVGATLAAVQAELHSWPYFFSAASNHFHAPRLQPAPGAAAVWTGLIGLAVLVVDRALRGPRARWTWPARLLRGGATGLVALAAAVLAAQRLFPFGGVGPEQQVVSVLLRYGGPVPLALGLLGLGLGLRRAEARALPWLALGAVTMALAAFKQGVRYEFYYARYLVEAAVPTLAVATACLIGHVMGAARRRWGPRAGALIGAALALAWIAPPLRSLAREVFWARDLADDPEQLAGLFGQVPDDALLIFDARAPHRWRGILAVPALLTFGRNVLVYPEQKIVERALTAGTPVYLLSGGWEADERQRWPDGARGPWRTEVVARGVYRAPRAEVVFGGAPERMTDWGGPYELQRLDPSVWRDSGALSLYRGSAYVASTPGGLVTEALEGRWGAGWRIELWLAEGGSGCRIAAALDGRALAAIAEARRDRRLWALPPDPAGPRRIEITAACPGGAALSWHRLSVRPGD